MNPYQRAIIVVKVMTDQYYKFIVEIKEFEKIFQVSTVRKSTMLYEENIPMASRNN